MKMLETDYTLLKQYLDRIASTVSLGDLERKYCEAGLSPMRFRWDVLHKSGLQAGDGRGAPSAQGWNVYSYLNDTHIDSALRRYMSESGLRWACSLSASSSRTVEQEPEEEEQRVGVSR